MGVVYEATDTERDERIALKTLHEMDAEALFRFKREFRTLHGIQHPNLVRLGDLVEHHGVWFFTMELVDGESFLDHVWTKDWRDEARAAVLAPTVRDATQLRASAESSPRREVAFDEPKLRAALAQLGAGIAAVHAAGKVHRDIKPSNVVVGRDGRVVLLDFGLITGTEHGDRSTVAGLCGTPEYMAPEQISDGRVGPPADWYSFGVVLYEALTGQLPVKGTPMSIMADKLRVVAPAPRLFAEGIPEDLETLCLELLRIDPSARPTGRDITARLLQSAEDDSLAALSEERPSVNPFIGRHEELTALEDAWARFRRDRRASSVFVDAESGMGKSALLAAFKRQVIDSDSSVVVFEGRGYQHESIPYNTFDHVIDTLSRFLRSLSAVKAAELMPRNAWLLPHLFPILGRVGPISRLTRAMTQKLDAHELRTRCFAAFRELLARIAERQPLVVILDDLQWAGRDSLMLLGEIMRPPNPPPLFLVLASREPNLPDPHARKDGESVRWWAFSDDLVRVSLGPLPSKDACTFAAYLIDRAQLGHLDPVAVAKEAEGHPLLIQALVRYASVDVKSQGDRPRLDDAILARTRGLPKSALHVLNLAMVAGGPIARDVLASAAKIDLASFEHELGLLESAYLLRAARMHAAHAVEPFHDRVRVATLAALAPDERRDLHAELAAAYVEGDRPDPVALTRHLAGAGDEARAAETALQAAEEAEGRLAFDRAAAYYSLALELRKTDASHHGIRLKFADALARAGRCVEAAQAYEAASREAEGALVLELQGYAAQQYVRAGHFERGMVLVGDLLASMGLRLPTGGKTAILRMLAIRFVLRVRSLRIKVRPAGTIAPETSRRIDLLHDLALVTSGVNPITGAWLAARAFLDALDSGDPTRVSRAVCVEAAWSAALSGGSTPRVAKLMTTVHAMERASGSRTGWPPAMEGGIAFLSSSFSRALEHLAESRAIFAEQSASQLEVDAVHVFSTFTLYSMGRIAELREVAMARLGVALDTGDGYHAAFQRLGPCNVASWLAPDQPDRGLEEADAALASWSLEGFDIMAFLAFLARTENALYSGKPELAWEEVQRVWRPMSTSSIFFSPWLRTWATELRGRAALAYALSRPLRQKELLAEAARAARRIDHGRAPTGQVRAALLRAGLHASRGDRESEIRALEATVTQLSALELGAHAAAARRRLGTLRGGDDGRALVQAADAWFESQNIRRPDRWARMLVPSAGDPPG